MAENAAVTLPTWVRWFLAVAALGLGLLSVTLFRHGPETGWGIAAIVAASLLGAAFLVASISGRLPKSVWAALDLIVGLVG